MGEALFVRSPGKQIPRSRQIAEHLQFVDGGASERLSMYVDSHYTICDKPHFSEQEDLHIISVMHPRVFTLEIFTGVIFRVPEL